MTFATGCLRQSVRRDFTRIFSLLPGEKILLVDPQLLKALDRVASMSTLRQLSVTKVFKIAESPPKADYERIAYMIPSEFDSCISVIKHCEVDQSKDIRRTRLIIFVPKEIAAMTYLLESRGFLGRNVCTASLSLSWIQLDTDLVTLNLPNLYPDFYLYKDYSWPHYMGMELGRLLKLTSESDLAPMGCRVHALGEASHVVAAGIRLYCIQSGLVNMDKKPSNNAYSQLNDQRNGSVLDENNSLPILDSQSSSSASLSSISLRPPPLVLIFSRDLDYITPLLVPMTFEALIHEVIGIELVSFKCRAFGNSHTTFEWHVVRVVLLLLAMHSFVGLSASDTFRVVPRPLPACYRNRNIRFLKNKFIVVICCECRILY
uniref:Uncharacterized protein n=1 Tax=Trichobilharzia regenti TaxID=157069 RepID=A0AA85J8X9_TRIRE|nr:unnamed protein product [Trichobilharzia regenti]